jgi:hypothetical protein
MAPSQCAILHLKNDKIKSPNHIYLTVFCCFVVVRDLGSPSASAASAVSCSPPTSCNNAYEQNWLPSSSSSLTRIPVFPRNYYSRNNSVRKSHIHMHAHTTHAVHAPPLPLLSSFYRFFPYFFLLQRHAGTCRYLALNGSSDGSVSRGCCCCCNDDDGGIQEHKQIGMTIDDDVKTAPITRDVR